MARTVLLGAWLCFLPAKACGVVWVRAGNVGIGDLRYGIWDLRFENLPDFIHGGSKRLRGHLKIRVGRNVGLNLHEQLGRLLEPRELLVRLLEVRRRIV